MSNSAVQFPSLMLAVSAVLVDAAFPREQYRDRIWAQLLLWLGVSLQQHQHQQLQQQQQPYQSYSMLLHSVFACSVLSCTYVALVLRWSFSLWAAPLDYTRLLAPSMLVALVYETIQLQYNSSMNLNCWFIFWSVFGSISAWTWYTHRHRQQRESLVGMPVVNSAVDFSKLSLQESDWSHWTRSQVLKWIASLDMEWRFTVCARLAPEGITGSILKQVSTEDLRSMNVSYGDARRLVDQIQLLISKYPIRNHHDASRYGETEQRNTFREWYVTDETPFHFKEPMANSPPTSYFNETEGINEEVVKKAKAMMKERFGFHLPDFKTDTEDKSAVIPEEGIANREQSSKHNKIDGKLIADDNDKADTEPLHDAVDIPVDLLAAMPQHVRDVAIRKPELVKELWTTYHLQSKDRTVDPDRIRSIMKSARRPQPEETTLPNESDDDEETTKLLRKRVTNSKYASIR